MSRTPSYFVLVPGPWRNEKPISEALLKAGLSTRARDGSIEAGEVRYELVPAADLADGFRYGRYGPLSDDVLQRVAASEGAALLELAGLAQEDPQRLATAGRALREAGGVAVRMEASGCASEWEPWLERVDADDPGALYEVAVSLVGDEDGTIFTCGMHQFALPDAQISAPEPQAAATWLDIFCIYQLREKPVLGSGHTFQPDEESPRRVLERWPDHRHHTEDGRHNPFGVWRFLAEGERGVEASNPVATITPPLVVVLRSAEEKKGAPLTEAEVTAMVEKAPAIALALEDARQMEVSRGYADLDPERAWAQWQIFRELL